MQSSRSGIRRQYRQRYFTLVEILAVVAIIGLLMGIGIGVYSVAMNSAKRAKTQTTIKKLEVTLEALKVKYGIYPQNMGPNMFFLNLAGSQADSVTDYLNDFRKMIDYESVLNTSTRTITISGTPYPVVTDGWGNPLYYNCPGEKNRTTFDIISLGPDKKVGDGSNVLWNTSWSLTGATTNLGKGDDLTNFN